VLESCGKHGIPALAAAFVCVQTVPCAVADINPLCLGIPRVPADDIRPVPFVRLRRAVIPGGQRVSYTPPPALSAPFPVLLATSSRAAPPGSESPDRPLRSKSISGADNPPKSATSAMRFLLWGTPQNCASCSLQATEKGTPPSPTPERHPACGHPPSGTGTAGASLQTMRTVSSRTAAKSFPPLELNAPGTFSQTMNLGRTNSPALPRRTSSLRISFMTLICSMNRPDRAPARPALFPATERSWQGDPPVITSTGGTSAPFNFVMSPKCFTGSTPLLVFRSAACPRTICASVRPRRTCRRRRPRR